MSEKRPLSPDLYRVDYGLASEICQHIEQRISEQDNPTMIKWTPSSRVADFEADTEDDSRAMRVFAQTFAESMLGQLYPSVYISDGAVDTRYRHIEVLAASELDEDMESHKRMTIVRINLGDDGVCTQALIANENTEVLRGYTFLLEPRGFAHCYRVYEVVRDELRDKVYQMLGVELAGDIFNAFHGFVTQEEYDHLVQRVKESAAAIDGKDLQELLAAMANRYAAQHEKLRMEQDFKMQGVDEDELHTLRLLLS